MQYVGTVQPEHKMRHDNFKTPLHWELFVKYNSFERNGVKQKVEPVSENEDRNILWDLNTTTVVQGGRG